MSPLVSATLKTAFDSLPGCSGCKDQNSVFQYVNADYGKLIGLHHHQDAIGRTDFDMPCETAACAALFREQDHTVMKSGKTVQILDVHPFANGQWRAYLFTKKPWRDDENHTIGTIFHGIDITSASIVALSSQLSKSIQYQQNSYLLSSAAKTIALSRREAEVLFLSLHDKTARFIANTLLISPRTVEHLIELLKSKFNALNKAELLDKASALGYAHQIPQSLFSQQLSVILAT